MTVPGGRVVVVVGDPHAVTSGLEAGPYNWPPHPAAWLQSALTRPDGIVVVAVEPAAVLDLIDQTYGADAPPAVVVGVRRAADRAVLLAAGAGDVMPTPVEVAELVARVDRAIDTQALRQDRDTALAALGDARYSFEHCITMASHDLKEPLRSINGFTGLLRDRHSGSLDDTAKAYLEYILDGAARLASLLEALQELSTMTRRQILVEDVQISAAVDAALDQIRTSGDIGEPTISVDLGAVRTLRTDRVLLQVCLRQVLSNSLKFVSDERAARVRVSADRAAGGAVRIVVEDNGIGVAETDIDRVFSMFSRLHGREVFAGHGIGLGLVALIARRLGGTASMASEPGTGTEVTLRLPAAGPPVVAAIT